MNLNNFKMKGNEFGDVMADIWMPTALKVLRENSIIAAVVNTDTQELAMTKGDVVNVSLPVSMGEADDFIPGVGVSDTDIISGKVSIKLDQHKAKQFKVSDRQYLESEQNLTLPNAAESAVKSICNFINKYVYSSYKEIFNVSGSTLTGSFDVATMIDAESKLNESLVPENETLYAALTTTRHGQLVKDMVAVDFSGDDVALRQKRAGLVAGLVTYRDQLLNKMKHTSGTAFSDTLSLDATVAEGVTSIVLTGVTAGNTVKQGDVLNITLDNGEVQANNVAADAVEAAGTITVSLVYPIQGAATAGASVAYAITDASYDINLAFHSDFYTLVMRPIAAVSRHTNGVTIITQTDPLTGIPLKLEAFRDSQTGEDKWRFEALFGGQVVRPDFCTVIAK
jgi:hypothetical protein